MEKSALKCPIDVDQIEKAVLALRKYENLQTKDKSAILVDQKRICLNVVVHKVAAIRKKHVYLNLPHPLYTKTSDICFITKDIDKKDTDKTQEYYEDLLRKNKVTQKIDILPITRLKLDYKAFESKRKLCNLYDLFLCEESILHRMPSLTGKYFYQKRKHPNGIQMPKDQKKLKNIIAKKMSTTEWYISGDGPNSSMTIAWSNFSVGDIVDNIVAGVTAVVRFVPRGWENVQSLQLKTDTSVCIPFYLQDNCPEECEMMDQREVNYITRQRTRNNALNTLMQQGGIKLKKRKKRPIDDREIFLGDAADLEEREKRLKKNT